MPGELKLLQDSPDFFCGINWRFEPGGGHRYTLQRNATSWSLLQFPPSPPPYPLQNAFPLDESLSGQLQIDFFTGQPTDLWRPITSSAGRAACSALNRERARGILETFKLSPSSESLSTDVWTTNFTLRAREWSLPLISLTKLGLVRDQDGLVCPPSLFPLKPGAEAEPYRHRESGMVYSSFMKRTAPGRLLPFAGKSVTGPA